MKRTIVAIALAALAAAVIVPVAQAAKLNVFIDSGSSDFFVGHVEGKQSCLEGRKVTLYFVKNGKDSKIGSDETFEGKGETIAWLIKTKNDNLKDGDYYAKVKDSDDCPGGKSKRYAYPPASG